MDVAELYHMIDRHQFVRDMRTCVHARRTLSTITTEQIRFYALKGNFDQDGLNNWSADIDEGRLTRMVPIVDDGEASVWILLKDFAQSELPEFRVRHGTMMINKVTYERYRNMVVTRFSRHPFHYGVGTL